MARAKTDGASVPGRVDDALAREVSIKARIDKSGLTLGGTSRALAAADQLVGAVVGIPGGWLEGVRRRSEMRRTAREQFLKADIAAAMQSAAGLSDLGQATLQRVLRDEYRKQDNRGAVWVSAEEHLALPPPQDPPPADAASDDVQIDPDWLSRFTGFAEDVSSEELQAVWGRVLAGEIRKPGSFSGSTLRVLAELEPDIAKSFEELYKRTINEVAAPPGELKGLDVERFGDLEAAGLIHFEQFMRANMNPSPDGFAYLMGEKWGIRVSFLPGNTQTSFPLVRLTRVGQQLGSILHRDEAAALREIAAQLTGVSKVDLLQVTGRLAQGTTFNFMGELPHKTSA